MPYADPERQREYIRAWKADRRTAWLAENGPCSNCGSAEDLEVDHVDPTKKIDHKVWTWSKERRLKELSKCQVLCFECHKKKSVEEGTRQPTTHGTRSRYRAGCRCDLCSAWNTSDVAERRARRRLRDVA